MRIPGGARLRSGGAQLYNVDDNSAVVLARDDQGLFAVSAICTHMCCLLTLCDEPTCARPRTNPGDCRSSPIVQPSRTALALVCPCHGSTFRLDGTVISGPLLTTGASTPLPHYAVAIQGDDAVVSIGEMVGAGTRTL